METIWFIFVALMVTMYVLLDGFDLGAGAVHLFVARNDRERRTIIRAIGPVWDGNEVWLIAAGGTLFFAFPTLYASGFSGFYLSLIIVLWLLMIRGLSIELRGHINDPMWASFWDAAFFVGSSLLAVFLRRRPRQRGARRPPGRKRILLPAAVDGLQSVLGHPWHSRLVHGPDRAARPDHPGRARLELHRRQDGGRPERPLPPHRAPLLLRDRPAHRARHPGHVLGEPRDATELQRTSLRVRSAVRRPGRTNRDGLLRPQGPGQGSVPLVERLHRRDAHQHRLRRLPECAARGGPGEQPHDPGCLRLEVQHDGRSRLVEHRHSPRRRVLHRHLPPVSRQGAPGGRRVLTRTVVHKAAG